MPETHRLIISLLPWNPVNANTVVLHSPLEVSASVAHGGLQADRWWIRLSKLMDSACVVGALASAVIAYTPVFDAKYFVAALLATMLFSGLAEIGGLYRPWRGESTRQLFVQILLAWVCTFFALMLFGYAFKISESFSRVVIAFWLLATPFLLTAWRMVYSRLALENGGRRSVLVCGSGDLGDQLIQTIEQSSWLGLRLSEYVRVEEVDCPQNRKARPGTVIPWATLERIEQKVRRGDIDILYIALPTAARADIAQLLDRLSDTTVTVYMVPDYFTTSLFNGKWSNLEGIPLISVYDTPFWGVDGGVKRAEDIVLSSLILLVAAVPMLLIAAAVKLTSPGPVLFKQRRYGVDGQEISVWKFRTMRVCEDGPNVPQARRNDPRVTPLGTFLRRTSLDELPQFINVLMGDMSIVGPRPHAVAHNELYRRQVKGYMLRHKVRPGITGWAQINGWRGETDTLEKMQKRIEHDLWYIRNWSLWLDLKITFLTVLRGLVGANAY